MVDTTGEKMKDAASSAQEMAGRVADQAREYGEQAQAVAKQVRPFLDKSDQGESDDNARRRSRPGLRVGRPLEELAVNIFGTARHHHSAQLVFCRLKSALGKASRLRPHSETETRLRLAD
jgi:hypothetical protein